MNSLDKNIKRIIDLMEKNTTKKEVDFEVEEEISEEGETAGGGSAPSTGYPTVTKWETGLTRGPGNPIGNAKRQDKTARGKANRLI